MRFACLALALGVCSVPAFANGIAVVDASAGLYVPLSRSAVDVQVEGQVAVTTATHTFVNTTGAERMVDYTFPVSERASVTNLRWRLNGVWRTAVFQGSPQGGFPGTGTLHPALEQYLDGSVPLIFDIDTPLAPDSALVVELTMVELLPYGFGAVDYTHPNDYRLIQTAPLEEQRLSFTLVSPRAIDSIQVLSHATAETTNTGAVATAAWASSGTAATADYRIRYTLDPEELGLFGFSTVLPDSSVADDGPPGFLLFVAEPDPGDLTESIDKVFTLIVDRSGSMSGTKIQQARNAARFIVENLNEGDLFNIVDFASGVSSFRPDHVPFTPATRDAALAYINTFVASGGTNISGAFDIAVPQFEAASDSTANLIVFFTDGEATAGITSTPALVAHVTNLIDQTETGILLFTFGIGDNVNRQLLTLLASGNDGLAAFLGSDELEARITEFYLTIRNPVLLDAQVAFSPAVVAQTHPDPAPNLYKGRQMIVAGRYTEAVPVTVTLSGTAFGQPVFYPYTLALSDSTDARYQFLTKVWAKLAIEDLLVQYYALPPSSPAAEALRQQIIDLSIAFGVLSPFTSLGTGEPPVGTEDGPEDETAAGPLVDLGASPNPFSAATTIRFRASPDLIGQTIHVRVYNLLGQLVRVLTVTIAQAGEQTVAWDGRTQYGDLVAAGVYVYVIESEQALAAGRMTVVR